MMMNLSAASLATRKLALFRARTVAFDSFSDAASSSAVDKDDNVDQVQDTFQLLGLPRKFAISAENLKTNYRKLMTEFHPDKHGNKSSEEKEYIDAKASQVTNAFQTLRHAHTRATHLLDLVGQPMDETSQGNLVGEDFLMDVMEIRESIDSTDATNMKPLWDETQQKIHQVCEKLDVAFNAQDFPEALKLSAMLQYWHRIEVTIHEKMEDE
jgi:molecular chaperone HscB